MTEPNHKERTHEKLGSSSANRWMNCTGSVFYIDQLPEQEESDAAKEGTTAHELAEVFLDQFLNYKLNGESKTINTSKYSEEMVEGAEFYTQKIWKELLDESITSKGYGMEEKFYIDEALHMGGIVDFYSVFINDQGKRTLVSADYKFGYHEVEAKNNAQLAFINVAIRKELQRNGKDIDLAISAIIQPRLTDEKKRFKKEKFTAKQLDTWEKKFYKAAEAIFVKKQARFKVGSWCKFCPAKAICSTYNKKMSEHQALKLIDPDEVKLPAPESLSPDALIKIVKNYDTVKDFIDACYTFALNAMKKGKKYKGLKLVEGRSRRKWVADEDRISTGLQEHKIEPFTKELKNITAVEKELKATYTEKEAKEILSQFTESTIASLSIVSEDDPRPAAKNLLDKL